MIESDSKIRQQPYLCIRHAEECCIDVVGHRDAERIRAAHGFFKCRATHRRIVLIEHGIKLFL